MTPATDSVKNVAGAPPVSSGHWWRHEVVRRMLSHRTFMIGAVLFFTVLVVTLLAPWIAQVDPLKVSMRNSFKPPSANFWFGTDNLGRDLLSRVLYGGRASLLIGFVVVIVNAVAAVGIGAVAGYFRRLDNPLMLVNDQLRVILATIHIALSEVSPALTQELELRPIELAQQACLALGIAAALGPSMANAMIALAVVAIPGNARLVRSTFLVIREMTYVEAATAAGARPMRIIMKHILPNCMAPLVVALSFTFAYAVLAEAVLSFLGVGTPPPAPSWGGIIAEGRYYLSDAPWIILIPGGMLAVTVLSLNLLGDGLRDVLDPKLKVQRG